MNIIGQFVSSNITRIFKTSSGDPWSLLDGRSGAPSGPVNYPGLLNSYSFRPPWYVAGVDYRVGIDRSLYPTNASLKSAATDSLPSGATRAGDTITVTGNNVVMDGWDFSVTTGWNLLFTAGSGSIVSNCLFDYGATFCNLAVDNGASNVTVTKCEFVGSTTVGLIGRGAIEFNGVGTTTITYCWIRDSYAIGLVMTSQLAASPMTLVWKYNALENAGCGRGFDAGVHGDWVQQYNASTLAGDPQTGETTSQAYTFSLWYQSMDDAVADTQGLSLHSANRQQGPSHLTKVDNNVMVINSIAHASPTIIVYPPNLDGTGTITSNYVDPSSAAGTDVINIDPEFNPTGQPGHGPFSGVVTVSGNIDMRDGSTVSS